MDLEAARRKVDEENRALAERAARARTEDVARTAGGAVLRRVVGRGVSPARIHAALFTVAALFSINYIISKWGLREFSSMTFVYLRVLGAAILLNAFVRRRGALPLMRDDCLHRFRHRLRIRNEMCGEKKSKELFHIDNVVAVLVLKHRINKQALETSASTTAFDLRNLR